jgi:His/Glu/Gln/Arg/opine family amino acid ABC transporter permease subunit
MDNDDISKILPPTFLALLLGFVLILPLSQLGIPEFIGGSGDSLSLIKVLMISIIIGFILMLLFHFLLSSVDLNFSQGLTLGLYVSSTTLFWRYSTKFLSMSADYLSTMARSIPCKTGVGCNIGTEMNLAYYPLDQLTMLYGGFILICFLLVQNEFRKLQPLEFYIGIPLGLVAVFLKAIIVDGALGINFGWGINNGTEFGWALSFAASVKLIFLGTIVGLFLGLLIGFFLRKCVTSTFGISAFLLSYVLVNYASSLPVPVVANLFDLSPGTQVPFFFLGGALVSGILLLQNNIEDLVDFKNYSELRNSRSKSLSAVISVLSIVLFTIITIFLPFFQPISQDIPAALSLITIFVVICWTYILSREAAKPAIQSHRTAALAFYVLFPFVSYLLLRVFFLQNDGTNPVMLNRWGIEFDFMDKVNTFKINPWPIDAEPNLDSRWIFLKAAIINSTRVTLISIFFCTILGIIVGVTRLSNNKLASSAATVYVEVFRNLPLAVLLFLISTQLGTQMPVFTDEKYLLGGAIFYSNQGSWFATVSSYSSLLVALFGLAVLRIFLRFKDRIEPRRISTPVGFSFRRPFSKMGWKLENLSSDIFLLFALVLLIARVPLGEMAFSWLPATVFEALFFPFLDTPSDGNVQTLADNFKIALGPLFCLALTIYALLISTNIDDDGMNTMEIDDSEEGLRVRFTIWVSAIAAALGMTLAGGWLLVGEALSFPEYTKDWNNDGVIDAPGSWDIVAGTGFEITPAFLAMILGLTLFTAAVVAEIVRGSIQALPRGQVEAAISLSLNPYQRLRLVILPQALRSMVPLLNNQFMNVWKNSSLAVVVAYTDIFYVILVMMNNVGKLIPLFLLLLITYQAGSLTISAVMNWYNSRVTSVKI